MSRAKAAATGDNWLEDFAPYRLYRVTNRLNAKLMGRLKAAKINPSQWRILSVLKAYGALSIGRIVETTLMEQPTVSRVVVQLERDGRVSRRSSDSDQRVMEISLTEAGVAAFQAIVPTALRHQELAFKGFSASDIARLTELLARVEQNLEYYD